MERDNEIKKIVIYGAGGLGREIYELIDEVNKYNILGFLDDDAFVRMCYYLNLPGSSLKRVTLVEAQSKLVETVKEFYNLFDKIYLSMRNDANRSAQ